MNRPPRTRSIPCPACNGTKTILRRWISPDWKERAHSFTCQRCRGTGKIEIPVTEYQND
jgi:DnaJ-class molecular chaperone